MQSEVGIRIPPAGCFNEAQALCQRYGTLLVMDEVQTGMFRAAPFLASHYFGVQPDVVVMAKALSGEWIPSSAVLMTDDVYNSVYDSLERSIVHTSTFSENSISMRAALDTLDVLERARLRAQAQEMSKRLLIRLRQKLAGYRMFREVRGLGMLSAIEFGAPSELCLRIPFEFFRQIHQRLFGQVLVMRLFRDEHIPDADLRQQSNGAESGADARPCRARDERITA